MEPQDYDSAVGWCPECGDVELIVAVEWETAQAECFRYSCVACGWTQLVVIDAPDPNEMLLPPYDGR